MFQVPRDRDAYAVIRGYVFQIDETVDTWLDLNAGELLELERGEDIDLVSRLIGERSRADVESRLLQQVKHRENNITLRTPAAIEAMVNFWDHRRLNPSVHLRFKFLTNAAAGAEQLSPFPERLPGITIWEQIRSHELRDGDASEAACQLREFLTKLPRPEPIPGSTWTDWQAFLTTESTDGFRTFIEQFEWRTSRPSASDIVGHLHKKIESHGIASSQTEAQAVYERLFFYVSRLLSTAGIKRLTVEQRTAVLGQPTLPAEDRETLSVLRNVVAAHGNRLDQVEDSVLALGARLERVLFQHAPSAHLYVADCPLDLTVPKNVARLSPRQTTVDQLNTLREVTVWLSMHGGPDVGKSQLAIRIAAGHRNCAWIRFRHFQTSAEALSVLDAAMSALGGSKSHQHPTERYAAALSAVGPGSLIVLDDVPRIGSDDRFADRLALFARYAREAHVRILSTSQFELPLTIREYLGDALVHDCAAPSFTDDEAQDLFRAFSADSPFLESGQAKFLNRLAGGHPLLLAATAEFLAKRSWRFRDEDIDSLLRGDHTSRVLPEVIDRLTRTLAVPSRDLLYRLTLIFGPFEQSSVPTLADVLPSVDRPLERFNEILGTWVQRDTNLRFVVSPLVKPLGKTELAPAVRIDCHRALADAITDKGRMDQYDCERHHLQPRSPRVRQGCDSLPAVTFRSPKRAEPGTLRFGNR